MSLERINNVQLPNSEALESVLKSIHSRVAKVFFKRQVIIKDKLNNDVWNVQTGRLRSSIQSEVKRSNYTIDASIFTNVSYAARLEFGFNGSVQVKEHTRKINQAFGRPIVPQVVDVKAHSKNVNFKGRSYFYSSLKNLEEELEQTIDMTMTKEL